MVKEKYNVIGKKYGNLLVLEELAPNITPNGSRQRKVRVKCDCGNEYDAYLTSVRKVGKCKTCRDKSRRIDITGKKYGKLTVISMAEDYVSPSGNRLSRCNCKCDCGNRVVVNMSALVTGTTRSCGCKLNTKGYLLDLDVSREIDYEKNKEIGLNVATLTARTNKKIWWKCEKCGNGWFSTVASRTDGHGCPFCSGRNVIKGETDLESQYPELAKEFDISKNGFSPSEISCHSGRKVFWKGNCGHSWKATVSNRVGGTGCPRCKLANVSSFPEQAIYYYLKQCFETVKNTDKKAIGMELDIFIPEINVAIEYDGEAWHRGNKIEKDIKKNQLCKEKNIRLIRIREPKADSIEGCITIIREDATTNKSLEKAIKELFKLLNLSVDLINIERDSSIILSQYDNNKKENSLAAMFPEIAKEWDYEKNGNLRPDSVSKASRRIVWWVGKCGHKWSNSVSERTRGRECPYCSGKRILLGYNDLESNYPEIAKEWNYDKNDLLPNEVTKASKKKVWWKCAECGNEWIMAIGNRTGEQHQGCPVCARKRTLHASRKKVRLIETGEIFDSVKEASIKKNVCESSIGSCCNGRLKRAGGFHWEFLKND